LTKLEFSNQRDYDLRAQENLLIDLTGSLERIEKTISSGI